MQAFPTRAFFQPGEPIRITVQFEAPISGQVSASVFHLGEQIARWETMVEGSHGVIEGHVPDAARRGYLVRLDAGSNTTYTAFDILGHWTQAPRYGFLYDFSGGRSESDMQATLDHLLGLHVNGLQFYDWQYRHDTLLPPQDEFIDPLGRTLSLQTIRNLIEAAHQRGMAAMPYTAIYAASPDFAGRHADWQLCDAQGEPVDFADGFLKLMNPCGPWQAHFVQECQRVLDALSFDGIHVDQYGEPKMSFDAEGAPVDLPAGFAATLHAIREAISTDKALLFNLVHNWPVGAIAKSQLDFWYSELWPPATELTTLWRTIRDNRRLSKRPAVLAVYIPPEWETTVIRAQATILAAGGSHIAHGEHGRYLSDPYFPKSGIPSPALSAELRRLADFSVAYEEALVFADDVTEQWISQIRLNGAPPEPGRVVIHAAGNRLYLNLLADSGRWDQELLPTRGDSVRLELLLQSTKLMWCASPEAPEPIALSTLELPEFQHWLLVCLEIEENP